MGLKRVAKKFLKYLIPTLLVLLIIPISEINRKSNESKDIFGEGPIRCAIKLKDKLSDGYQTGYCYEMMERLAASLKDSTEIFMAEEDGVYLASLRLDSLGILAVPTVEVPESDEFMSFPLGDVPISWVIKSDKRRQEEIIRWLNVKLAPCISVHGVLVDVYGEGVLITGESGIGKSEAALELIRRGHRLVTDDVVELRKVSDDTLVGSAPDITKHFIELRGIGIVDVKALFGALSVKDTQTIDLVIRLEDWDKDKEYDRLGLEENYTEYLGNKVVCHNIPIRPGRNLAVICETAAINHRQKKMGYNAAKELYTRVQNSLAKRREEDEDDE